MKISKAAAALWIIIAVIIIDQVIKIWVKTNFYLGESYEITSWFQLVFVENNGMAFGMEFGSKLFLTLFRIIAVGVLGWIICRLSRRPDIPMGFMVCLALITAGAAGNIIDCMFYGLIFNNPMPPVIATMFPEGGGYASFLHGRVVDMFYFPLFSFDWPSWMPWIGGQTFLFFQPVFNFADAAISVGMIYIIIFYHRYLSGETFTRGTDDGGLDNSSSR